MLILAMACAPHTPPTLFPSPVPKVDFGDVPPNHGPAPLVVDVGDSSPVVGVVTSADDWSRLKTRSRLLDVALNNVDRCTVERVRDRAYCQTAFDDAYTAHRDAARREQGLRVAVPLAGLLGAIAGAGVAVAVAWAYPWDAPTQ